MSEKGRIKAPACLGGNNWGHEDVIASEKKMNRQRQKTFDAENAVLRGIARGW